MERMEHVLLRAEEMEEEKITNIKSSNAEIQPNTDRAFTESELNADPALWKLVANDPITKLLLTGQATTVHEAEAKYLNDNVDEVCQQVLALAESELSDEEFARQPLILLLRGHGSRRWEDSLL